MHRGYIKLWRRLKDSDFWLSDKFTGPQAWVDLLMLANHKDTFFKVRGQRVDVKRGQVAYSEVSLAERWKWSRGRVRRFLLELSSKTVQQIVQHKSNLTTLITIINYEQYQGDGTALGTPDGTPDSTADGTHLKNDKNVKNEKNKDMASNRRHKIPPDYSLTDNLLQIANKHGLNGDRINTVFEHFKAHHESRGTTMLNWDKAWLTWVINDKKYKPRGYEKAKRPPTFAELEAMERQNGPKL